MRGLRYLKENGIMIDISGIERMVMIVREGKNMKKSLFALAALALLWTGCGAKNQLTLYTWADMFPPEILGGFEKESGIRINYINFDTNETMLARLDAGGGYDLVIADDYAIETAIKKGLVQKLDKSELSNFGNINPMYQKQFYDPSDEYTVPYGAGIQTILYDPLKVKIPVLGFEDLWDPSLEKSVGIIGNPRVVNGMALKVLGQSYNTNDTVAIRAAGDMLHLLAPNIRLVQDDRLEDQLVSGEISAALMYTSNAFQAKQAKPELVAVFPEEGIGFGIMAGFIPAKAPNPDAAHKFLNYILDPEHGARCFEFLGYYSTFSASDSRIAPELRESLTLPSELDAAGMEILQNISPEALEEHERVWTEFLQAAGQSN